MNELHAPTIQKRPTQRIFALLFLSAIGTTLFFSAIPIYLRSIGLSTAQTALIVASTALPNMVLGARFGRWVDRSPKKLLFLWLSITLAMVEACLVFALAGVHPEYLFWASAANMQVAAMLFSPLSTLTYQYVIPSLDADETRAFAGWEVASGIASICAAGASLAVLMSQPVRVILIVDAFTLVVAGGLIYRWWPDGANASDTVETADNKRAALQMLKSDPLLMRTAIAMFAVAFTIHAFEANVALVSYDALRWSDSTSIALAAVLGAVSSASAWMLQRYSAAMSGRILQGQKFCLTGYIVIAAGLWLAFQFEFSILAVVALIAIAIVEPIWSVATTRFVRSRTPAGRYGEIHGLIRMPRALFTMAGATLFGYAHDAGWLWLFAALGCALLLAIRVSMRLRSK